MSRNEKIGSRQDIKSRMDDLTLALRRHNELYYDKNAPEISDYQYDRMLQDLQKLEEQNPDLVHENSPTRRVGGSTRGGLGNVPPHLTHAFHTECL